MGLAPHPKSPIWGNRIKKVKKTDFPKSGHSEAIYTARKFFLAIFGLTSRGLRYYGMILHICTICTIYLGDI